MVHQVHCEELLVLVMVMVMVLRVLLHYIFLMTTKVIKQLVICAMHCASMVKCVHDVCPPKRDDCLLFCNYCWLCLLSSTICNQHIEPNITLILTTSSCRINLLPEIDLPQKRAHHISGWRKYTPLHRSISCPFSSLHQHGCVR